MPTPKSMPNPVPQTLPDDFLWGGAVAAHQLEGGWDQGGKGPSVADVLTGGAQGPEGSVLCSVFFFLAIAWMAIHRERRAATDGKRHA